MRLYAQEEYVDSCLFNMYMYAYVNGKIEKIIKVKSI